MHNTNRNYDIKMISKKIKELRTLRYEQYIESQNIESEYSEEDKEYFSHFSFCKTQNSFATQLNSNRITVTNWENGTYIPSIDKLIIICQTLDCSLDYLLGSVDTPEIDPISKASHYSGIKAEIIRYGIENPDFLDCLNFFMHPQNSEDIFNSVTLGTWKKFWIDSSIEEINGELKEKILSIFDEYFSITPFENINKRTYKQFLEEKLPRKKITLKATNTDSKIYIKKCVSLITYQNFFSDKEFNYSTFINYLVEHTFESLSHNTMLEIKKNKLASKFTDLFIKYLDVK